MGDLIKYDNQTVIKWTLQITDDPLLTSKSKNFTIQDHKCFFLFCSGYDTTTSRRQPMSLSIDFDKKEKLNPSVNVTVFISSSSEEFFPARLTITGEIQQLIWSSFNFKARSSLWTFEMVTFNDAIVNDDKSVQTSSYIDACLLLDDTSKDFTKIFEEGLDHDVEFVFRDETIKAHKIILCFRSKVFESMLRNDMQERKTGQVKIEDMESGIFRRFLRCLYTGELSELTVDTALGFYEASDKYAVETLRKQCADFLMDHVSPENACEILLLADRHSDFDFKKNIIEYIIKVEEPITGDKWAGFCKENPVLANEVLNLYCKHLRQK